MTVKTLGVVVTETVQWTAEVLEWSFEVERKWLECGASQHLSSLACWQHFFAFFLSFFFTVVEMERLQERAL